MIEAHSTRGSCSWHGAEGIGIKDMPVCGRPGATLAGAKHSSSSSFCQTNQMLADDGEPHGNQEDDRIHEE